MDPDESDKKNLDWMCYSCARITSSKEEPTNCTKCGDQNAMWECVGKTKPKKENGVLMKWMCSCGAIVISSDVPEICPKCGAGPSAFMNLGPATEEDIRIYGDEKHID
eukprot:TRINITY_DN5923_c0_g1_i1.p1 TRINITY_DN5923_c0_g1~~TRINITY_DN5923_c0_g1_i1.p1  ORF type:complete len:108 (-),score=24.49 TRINITY_DN5923_c0_g1_i1:56-379(-)